MWTLHNKFVWIAITTSLLLALEADQVVAKKRQAAHDVVDHHLPAKQLHSLVNRPLNRHKIGNQIKTEHSSVPIVHSQREWTDGTALDMKLKCSRKLKSRHHHRGILVYCKFNESSNNRHNDYQTQLETILIRLPFRQKRDVAGIVSLVDTRPNFFLPRYVLSYLDTASKNQLQALGELLSQISFREILSDLTSKNHQGSLERLLAQGNPLVKGHLKHLLRRLKLPKQQLDTIISDPTTLRTVSTVVNAQLNKINLRQQLNDRPDSRTRHGMLIGCRKEGTEETAKLAKELNGLKCIGKIIGETNSIRSNLDNTLQLLRDAPHQKHASINLEPHSVKSQFATDKSEGPPVVNATRMNPVDFSKTQTTANTASISQMSGTVYLTALCHVIIRHFGET